MSKIGFIGLGNMGLHMAKNLVAAGHDVTGFDLSDATKSALVVAGGVSADTIAAAVAEAEIIVSMLPAGKHVSAVYTEAEGVLAQANAGALLIDSSTIDVDTARAVSAQAEAAGFIMVDAPVSGGVGGAAAGTLTFMVGGTEEGFAAAKPYLDIMGQNIFHAGGSGNGQVAKICNNMLLGISMIGTAEAFMLGEKLGLDAQTFFDISSTASGQCWSMTSYCPAPGPVPTSPANKGYAPGFTAAMMLKDLLLSQEAAGSAAAATPMGQCATELYTQMADAGDADMDFSGIVEALNK
ncbi:3-hydroxyisobutyrate dehydrogenase [Alphaproteobacteria bacterium]|nr:3-hydroxyisobutyrate dehydrogenase [Alphaproteobacteria bacterium]MDA8622573.1 3-hydroxyisobutyrate dehydrogenase [bacterium]MDA8544627.1 3-hydroxyisobutyrate dehydrogenase [Alphaproteobacteria bacterium]MDA8624264.1 3-hydroxyisobutyrate dehydrogenase [Alphaproteobacteria bacterium]MDA8642690.1 3-hydroxyisobutyrate dehydrogenase [Alphaproteobacteria bacterium]